MKIEFRDNEPVSYSIRGTIKVEVGDQEAFNGTAAGLGKVFWRVLDFILCEQQ